MSYSNAFPFPVPSATLWDGTTFNDDGFPADANGNIRVCGPETNWPVGMSFADAIKLYWRVKTWKLDNHLVDVAGGGAEYDYAPGTAANAVSEQRLIVQPNPPLVTANSFFVEISDPGNVFDNVDFFLFRAAIPAYNPVPFSSAPLQIDGNNVDFPMLQCAGLFYPAFCVIIQSNGTILDRTFLRDGDPVGAASAVISFDPATCIFTADSLQDAPGFPFQTYKVKLAPASWWPYGGRYNPATGIYVP